MTTREQDAAIAAMSEAERVAHLAALREAIATFQAEASVCEAMLRRSMEARQATEVVYGGQRVKLERPTPKLDYPHLNAKLLDGEAKLPDEWLDRAYSRKRTVTEPVDYPEKWNGAVLNEAARKLGEPYKSIIEKAKIYGDGRIVIEPVEKKS